MSITKITVGRTRKVNLGNFENADVYVELEATVGNSDDPDQVYVNLINKADEYLDAKVAELK